MPKKSLTITLYMSELIYDFQNKAFLTGRSRRASLGSEVASDIQASDDEEDTNQALRSIQGAYSALLTELSEGLYGDKANTSSNKLLSDSSNISIALKMPSNYVLGIRDSLTHSIHDFIINKALADWLVITDKADATEYAENAAVALKNIHEAFNRRERPTRKEV